MAILSNINSKFAVEDTGAIKFSNQTGTSGQILKSNGNAAPTWVNASTVIGGPYLPLSGGTLTGASATASGISFTVGGALTGTSATFSGNVLVGQASAVGSSIFQVTGASTLGSDVTMANGNVHIHQTGADYLTYIDFLRSSANVNPTARIHVTEPAATHTSRMEFYTSNASGSVPNLRRAMFLDQNLKAYFDGTIETAGNVGIGGSATFKLDVLSNGSSLRLNSSDANGAYITWANNGTAKGYMGSAYHLFASPNNLNTDIAIRAVGGLGLSSNDATTPTLYLTGGNVGIGTNSPGAKLQVVQTIADWTGGFKNYTANGYGLRVDMSGGSGQNAAIQAYTATGTGLIVKNNGRVGIGTFTPSQPLDVDGIMKHKGLDMTSGSQVDQVTTFNVTLVASANTWTDIPGINGPSIPSSGHYMVGLYSDARGSSGWYYVYWTTYMGWNLTSGTNASEFSEMPLTYGAHSTNGNSLELRTSMQLSSSMKIQFKVSFATSGTALRLIFRKLIS